MDWNKEIIFSYFEKNGINSDFDTEPELFKFYMSKPEEMLRDHILKTLKKGEIIKSNNDYVLFRWTESLLGTEVLIQSMDKGFSKNPKNLKVISVYPTCYECNRYPNEAYYPFEEEINGRTQAIAGFASFDFFDSHVVFEHDAYTDGIGDDTKFCIFGFAFAANTDLHTYLKEQKLTFSYKDNDGIDVMDPIMTIHTKLKDLVLFKHLGKKFYYFKFGEEMCLEQEIPIFIPAKILPRGTELFSDDEIELQIMLFGHEAIYENPDEPNLETYKFEMIAGLSGERIKSRAQIKQERIDYQYEFPEEKKETMELKSKPAEYFIRIINTQKTYEDQIIEQCELFNEKYGVYPNVIVANAETFNKWEESIDENIGDQEATDTKQLLLFEELESNKTLCEFEPDDSGKGTVFSTPNFKLHLVENADFQEGIYEILNGYSPMLEQNSFLFPIINTEATGKKIRQIMDEKGVTPAMISKVLGGVSNTAIYNWFNGKFLPRMDYFAVISNLLNTPIDDLLVVDNQKREKVE